MAQIRNCVTTAVSPDDAAETCCVPCQSNLSDNCQCEGCYPIGVSCSIDNAVCIPILADQLYDFAEAQKEDIGSLPDIPFTLDGVSPLLTAGQPVCITKIGITYDFIGLAENVPVNSQIVVDGQTFTLTPTSLFNGTTVPATPVYLFDELSGNIALQPPCCCNNPIQPGTRLRTIERNRAFQVANLRIVASGLIGCTPFTATAAITPLFQPNSTLIPLSIFGITNMSFTGRICWPRTLDRMSLSIDYDTNLSVDCITPTSNYIAPPTGVPGLGTFTANIDLSFIARRRLYVSSRGPIAVFTTPNAALLKNGEVIGNCLS